ncbi:MAG TPA: DUF92 domain-containing protein [Acidobacteriota bacterium]|jgi:uncharacterized protein (TIGR00297 family)|nr:DUF92 domain-containing protein [Acidobacteriota bacterium]
MGAWGGWSEEDWRQIEHLAPLSVAFCLPYLPFWAVIVGCAVAVVHALYLSPRWIGVTTRAEEKKAGWSRGKLYYALSVALVLVVFADRMYLAAGVWAILAVGDALSNLIGRRWGKIRFPGSRKTLGGLCAFWVGGSSASVLLMWWNGGLEAGLGWNELVGWSCTAAVGAGLVEALPLPFDDNPAIAWTAAAILQVLSSLDGSGVAWKLSFREAVVVNLAAGLVALGFKWLTPPAVGAAVVLGTCVLAGLGWSAFLLLALLLALGSLLSALSGRRPEERHELGTEAGRRILSVLSKGAVPAILSVIAVWGDILPSRVAFLAAVTAALGDTAGTEVGQWVRGKTYRLLSFQEVVPGTPGAVSVAGTLATVLSATALGVPAWALGWLPAAGVFLGATAGTAAVFWESWVGGERTGDSEVEEAVLNLFVCFLAASLGWWWTCWMV